MAKSTHRWAGPEFHVAAVFRAPLPYVFSWCTDFDPHDDRREKDRYTRKIVSRTPRRVVFEDLVDLPTGWNWARHDVTLFPPDRWHSDSVGSHRTLTINYVLTPLSSTRTRLDLRWKREATALATKVSKRAIERSTTQSWRNFARELEKDYRKSRTRPRRS
ncbi:MAG: hypothetical protein WB947_02155 [Thermoplasmata archaeon]